MFWYLSILIFIIILLENQISDNHTLYSEGFTCIASRRWRLSFRKQAPFHLSTADENDARRKYRKKDANEMLARAKEIRESLPPEKNADHASCSNQGEKCSSVATGYRLYFDIGREEGTWMDPRWGRSGNRIEGSIDVYFELPLQSTEDDLDTSLADEYVIEKMVQDNISGSSTAVRKLNCSNARLRRGFDKMICHGGGYRIDVGSNKYGQSLSYTLRFFIEVDGTEADGGSYGDIFIPKGPLYFSLPCFGPNVNQLSRKDGIMSVRQVGWHTGWRRMESRIVGVFRALPIDEAKKKDRF